MSLLTGAYFDVPTHEPGYAHYECGAARSTSAKRKFFAEARYGNGWDDEDAEENVVLGNGNRPQGARRSFAQLMERGGRSSLDDEDVYEDVEMT